jgi:hypothetical protein
MDLTVEAGKRAAMSYFAQTVASPVRPAIQWLRLLG